MTQRHFIALADAIKQHQAKGRDKFTKEQISTLATFCQDQNIKFKWNVFMDYIAGDCGPTGGAVKTPKLPK